MTFTHPSSRLAGPPTARGRREQGTANSKERKQPIVWSIDLFTFSYELLRGLNPMFMEARGGYCQFTIDCELFSSSPLSEHPTPRSSI